MHGLQLSLWVVVVFYKVWTELPMPLTIRVSLLWRAWSPFFGVRWLPLLHLALKISQLLFWSMLTQVMRKIKMWLSLTWPTSFTLLWVRNVFLLVGKKPRFPPLQKRLLAWSQQLPHVGCEWDYVQTYRLYANILRGLVIKWCVENRIVPDTQFGFYPDRSTIQPIVL